MPMGSHPRHSMRARLALLAAVLAAAPAAPAAARSPAAQLSVEPASLSGAAPMPRLWRTAPSGAASRLDTLPSQHALVRALPRWDAAASGTDETVLFTERISRVRLLGGWKPGAPTGDCVSVPAGQSAEFRADWPCLYARIDPVVAQNLSLVVVFDNVPWAFVRNTTGASGAYGNAKGPDADLRPLFSQYVTELVQRLAERYGKDEIAARWQWRAATEPNCECHWLSGADDYLFFYDTLAAAVKTTLGSGAKFGPGNMPRGMQMGMVDMVLRRLANATLTAHPPDVLGVSYYGGAGNGYRHTDMQGTYDWMDKYARMMSPAAAVQFMEYGTLMNSERHPSNEPSAFGAAWTAGGLVVALRSGISELYHWHFLDCVGRCDQGLAQQTLLYGWAWLLAVVELMVGLPAAPLTTTMDFSPDRNSTSVTGIAALDNADAALYAMVTVFGPSCYNSSSALSMPVPVTLSLPKVGVFAAAGLADAGAGGAATLVVEQWHQSSSNAVYDRIWRDLSGRGLLKRSSDPYTYRIKDMASEQGKQFVSEHFDEYSGMLLDSMRPTAFDGEVVANGTHVTLSWQDSCPAVRVLRVRPT